MPLLATFFACLLITFNPLETATLFQLMFIMAMISYEPATYENKVIPMWAEFIGWLMVLAPILCVIGRALKMLLYRKIGVSPVNYEFKSKSCHLKLWLTYSQLSISQTTDISK